MFDINCPSLPVSPGLAPARKAPIEDDFNQILAPDFVNVPYGSELDSWLQEDRFELEGGNAIQAQQEALPSLGPAIQPSEKTKTGGSAKYCEEKEMPQYQNILGEELFSSTTPDSASKEYSNSYESTLLTSERNSLNFLDSHDAINPMPEDLDSLNLRLVIAQSQMQLRLKELGLDAPGEDLDEALLDSQYMALKLHSARLKSKIKRIVHDAGEGSLQANALDDANPLTTQSGTNGIPAIGPAHLPGPHSHCQHVALSADQLSSPIRDFQCPGGMSASLSGDEIASASFDESFPVSGTFATSTTPSAPSQLSLNLCTDSPQAISDSVSSKRRSAATAGFFDCFDSIQTRSKRQRTVKTATENRSLVSADGGSCVRCKHLGLPCLGAGSSNEGPIPCDNCRTYFQRSHSTGIYFNACVRTSFSDVTNMFLSGVDLSSDFGTNLIYLQAGRDLDQYQIPICFHDIFGNDSEVIATTYLLSLNRFYDRAAEESWTNSKTLQDRVRLIGSESGLNVLIKTNGVLEFAKTWCRYAGEIAPYRTDFEQLRAYASIHAFAVLDYVLRPTNLREADLSKLKKIITFTAILYHEILYMRDQYIKYTELSFIQCRSTLDEQHRPAFDWIMEKSKNISLQKLDTLDDLFRNTLRMLIAMAFPKKSRLFDLLKENHSDHFLDKRFWKIILNDPGKPKHHRSRVPSAPNLLVVSKKVNPSDIPVPIITLSSNKGVCAESRITQITTGSLSPASQDAQCALGGGLEPRSSSQFRSFSSPLNNLPAAGLRHLTDSPRTLRGRSSGLNWHTPPTSETKTYNPPAESMNTGTLLETSHWWTSIPGWTRVRKRQQRPTPGLPLGITAWQRKAWEDVPLEHARYLANSSYLSDSPITALQTEGGEDVLLDRALNLAGSRDSSDWYHTELNRPAGGFELFD